MAAPDYIDSVSASALMLHANNGAQRQADAAAAYADDARRAYLTGKDRISFAEATGVRHVEESGSSRSRQTTNEPPANR